MFVKCICGERTRPNALAVHMKRCRYARKALKNSLKIEQVDMPPIAVAQEVPIKVTTKKKGKKDEKNN